MGLRKKVEKIAAEEAKKVVDAEMQAFMSSMSQQQTSETARVKEIIGPNKFVVEAPDGKRSEITYIGNRPVGTNGVIILGGNGKFGR